MYVPDSNDDVLYSLSRRCYPQSAQLYLQPQPHITHRETNSLNTSIGRGHAKRAAAAADAVAAADDRPSRSYITVSSRHISISGKEHQICLNIIRVIPTKADNQYNADKRSAYTIFVYLTRRPIENLRS